MDETNIHVPQTKQGQAEAAELLAAGANIVSGQSSKPIQGIVQDCLLGGYKMTQGWVWISKDTFNNICMTANLNLDRMAQISTVYMKLYGVDYLYTGRGLLSMCLPVTYNYSLTNKAYDGEPILKIRNGVIIEGAIDKSAVGPTAGAIHHYMTPAVGLKFLTNFQHTVNNWVKEQGISVGIIDCIPTVYDKEGFIPQVREHVEKCYLKAKIAESTQSNPIIAEIKINSALNAARDVGQKMAKDLLSKSNRFFPMILSRSKGTFANITQITSLLGQQNISGQRLELSCTDGKRALPHYEEVEDKPERQFESRGFIRHSFISGLNPQEFWAHAASSREGIINTACTTAKTGYFQRRMTEMLKNLSVQYDYTVRNADGKIVQFVYGDGLAPYKQHKVDGTLQCFLSTKIEEINTQYEMDCYASGKKIEDFVDDIAIVIPDKIIDDDIPSPVGSDGSGSEPESPDSFGSQASIERDDFD